HPAAPPRLPLPDFAPPRSFSHPAGGVRSRSKGGEVACRGRPAAPAAHLVSSAGNPLRISADPGGRRQGAGLSLVPGVLGRASNAADVRLGRRDMWRISGGG